jgi:hypothetical protein
MPTPLRAALVVLGLAALSLPTTADAEGRSKLIRSRNVPTLAAGLAGPMLGGDRVVWAEQPVMGRWRIRTAPLKGANAASTSVRYSAGTADRGLLDLAASASRIAVSTDLYDCSGELCQRTTVVGHRLAVSTNGGPFEVIENCSGETCSFSGACDEMVRWVPSLSGQVLAYTDRCAGRDVIYRDLAPGADHARHVVPAETVAVAAAGRYLAWLDPPNSETARLVVYDRVAAGELYSVDVVPPSALPGQLDVQDDGKAVYVDRDGLEWASPSAPTAHRVASSGFFQNPRIADDLIAFARPDFGRGRSAVRVVDLDGKRVTSASADGLAAELTTGLDFDGKHVVFGSQPCQTAAIVVWDIAGRAPHLPRERCPAARFASDRTTRTPSDRLKVRLACPGKAKLGCIGSVRLVADARGRHASGSDGLYTLGTSSYEIGRGRSRTASVELTAGAAKFLDRHPKARVAATSISLQRPDLGAGHHFQTIRRMLDLEVRH